MRKVNRRRFLAGAAAVGFASMAASTRRVYGANETLGLGFIGVGGRGTEHTNWFTKSPQTRVAGLCDPDLKHMAAPAKKHEVPADKMVQDLRRMLDDKSVDAVVIASCNHWHALAAIWAMQAGKDVYVEKPISQTVWEGRQMTAAARKYKKICQGGTQQRSDPVQDQIRELTKSGKHGKMQWIRGQRFGVRKGIGKRAEPLKVPEEVNYDLWLGPAQDEPIFREKFHYDWHWDWNTGSGEMGNWGVHILDDIRNQLGVDVTLPTKVLAGGGRIAWNDAGETPNVHFVYFDTPLVPVIFSLSNLPVSADRATASPAYRKAVQSGYVIQYEDGTWYGGGRGGGWTYDKEGKKIQQFKGDGGGTHAKNFLDACRSRDHKTLKADVETAHYSSAWCHLANVAYRLGTDYTKEKALGAVKGAMEGPWAEMIEEFDKHVQANGVADPAKGGLKVSGMMEFDPAKETFTGAAATPEALKLLTREYRKPYVVPEIV